MFYVVKMSKCQICREPIWENQWRPSVKQKVMRKFVCFYCFSRLRDGKYKPMIVAVRSGLAVCDKCGEVAESTKSTDSGWLCEDCVE